MSRPKVTKIDGEEYYSIRVVTKLLETNAASVRRIAGKNNWDYANKRANGPIYYRAAAVNAHLSATGSPLAKSSGASSDLGARATEAAEHSPEDRLSLDIPEELAARIDLYKDSINREWPYRPAITKEDAVRELISIGLDSQKDRLKGAQ